MVDGMWNKANQTPYGSSVVGAALFGSAETNGGPPIHNLGAAFGATVGGLGATVMGHTPLHAKAPTVAGTVIGRLGKEPVPTKELGDIIAKFLDEVVDHLADKVAAKVMAQLAIRDAKPEEAALPPMFYQEGADFSGLKEFEESVAAGLDDEAAWEAALDKKLEAEGAFWGQVGKANLILQHALVSADLPLVRYAPGPVSVRVSAGERSWEDHFYAGGMNAPMLCEQCPPDRYAWIRNGEAVHKDEWPGVPAEAYWTLDEILQKMGISQKPAQ